MKPDASSIDPSSAHGNALGNNAQSNAQSVDQGIDKSINQSIDDSVLINVDSLSVRQRGRTLIDNVSLQVRRGEIVTIIGPNGSGKSTTIKAMLGIIKANSGQITKQPNLSIGYVPQKLEINWSMPLTVERFMRLTDSHSSATILAALTSTGAQPLLKRELTALSGGEFQRVLIARAMASEPDLLVLDEPVQGVDFNAELEIYQLIASLRDQHNCGVLLVSHDLHIVMAKTDTVVCLNGHVCCSGSPRAVTNSNQFQNLFGVRGAEALAIYKHHHDHKHGPAGEVIPDGHDFHSTDDHSTDDGHSQFHDDPATDSHHADSPSAANHSANSHTDEH